MAPTRHLASKADIARLLTITLLIVRKERCLFKREGLERTFCFRLWYSEHVFMTFLLFEECRPSIVADKKGGSFFLPSNAPRYEHGEEADIRGRGEFSESYCSPRQICGKSVESAQGHVSVHP